MHTGEGFIFKGKAPLLFFQTKINSQQTSIALRPGHRTDLLCEGLSACALLFRIERSNWYKLG